MGRLDDLAKTETVHHWTKPPAVNAQLRLFALTASENRAAELAEQIKTAEADSETSEEELAILHQRLEHNQREAADIEKRIKKEGVNAGLQIRFILRPATARTAARRRLAITEAGAWFEEETGQQLEDAEDWPTEHAAELAELYNSAARIARATSSIERIETREIDYLTDDPSDYSDAAGAWTEEPIPESWLDIAQAIETFPLQLASELSAQAEAIARGYVPTAFLPAAARKERSANAE